MSAIALMVSPVKPSVALLGGDPELVTLVMSDMGSPWLVGLQTPTSALVSGVLQRKPEWETKMEDQWRVPANVSRTFHTHRRLLVRCGRPAFMEWLRDGHGSRRWREPRRTTN